MTGLRREPPRTVCVASWWRHGVLQLARGVMWIGAGLAVGASEMAAAAGPASSSGFERGDDLCALLTPGDFNSLGIKGAKKPQSNSSPPTDFYCVYAGLSSYKGGIEFDAFLADSAKDAKQVFETATQEADRSRALDRAKELGVDQALLQREAKGDPSPFASLSVRSGKFVFVIGFPSNPNAEEQLMVLARKVLQRGEALTK